LKAPLDTAAFFGYGVPVAKRPALPSIGWALLGGAARLMGGTLLGYGVLIGLDVLDVPTIAVLAGPAFLRIRLWWWMAKFLYETPSAPAFAFAVLMTGMNFLLDGFVFGRALMDTPA